MYTGSAGYQGTMVRNGNRNRAANKEGSSGAGAGLGFRPSLGKNPEKGAQYVIKAIEHIAAQKLRVIDIEWKQELESVAAGGSSKDSTYRIRLEGPGSNDKVRSERGCLT
jgi:hypothetical protein